MELYESLFIIRASVSDQETAALIEKMKAVAEKTGAQFINQKLGQEEACLRGEAGSGRGATLTSTSGRPTSRLVNCSDPIVWKIPSSNF